MFHIFDCELNLINPLHSPGKKPTEKGQPIVRIGRLIEKKLIMIS